MKFSLGIFTLLLVLQMFQQVSTNIPSDWEKDGSSKEVTNQPIEENVEDYNVGEAAGYILNEEEKQDQNSTELDQPGNETEEAVSQGPLASTPLPMITLNSSSEISNTSEEFNKTKTQETVTNSSTPEPKHTQQPDLNATQTTPNTETNTAVSSSDDSGSGYFPSDDVPTNSTTKSPSTTTKDVGTENNTAESPTEPPHKTTTVPPAIPENATTPVMDNEDKTENLTGKIGNRENSVRDSAQDTVKNVAENKNKPWAVVLGIGIVVGVIALVAFIVLNRRNRRDFSHRKLEEDMSPDPVLRLDNSEPLDLKFDGFGYYNPGLEPDNIQMTNFPMGRSK